MALRFESEAGVIEFWDATQKQFECAGVQAVRQNGLLLPYYTNTSQLMYIIQGRGIQLTVIPGCAETYERQSGESITGERRQSFNNRHQKLRRFLAGDVIALPAGITFWMYNDAEEPIDTVSLLDTSNHANQLDLTFRSFFLVGNPQRGVQQQFVGRQQEIRSELEKSSAGSGNIFNGFNAEILSEAFNVDIDMYYKETSGQNEVEERGVIMRAEELRLVLPEESEEEEEGGGGRRRISLNGLEETLSTMKLRENIGNPSRSDVYNPRGGRVKIVNSNTLPILNWLQLSAERGTLYQNAIVAPHWNTNAHSIIYIIRGSGRIQVVGSTGKSVFDDEVRENQLLIVPQNFAIVKRAGNEGLEYISFKTIDNAMTSPLAGRLSVLRAIPEEVLMNSYQIDRQEARSLKYYRDELKVSGPGSRSSKGLYA